MRLTSVVICLCITTLEFVTGQSSDEERLKQLQDDFREWRLEIAPEYSTRLQIYKYNDRLDSFDYNQFNNTKSRVDDYLSKLSNIQKASLTDTGKNNYDIFNDVLQTVEQGYPWRKYTALTPISNLEGPQRDPSDRADITPFYTRGDFENYLVRLDSFPKQIDERIDRMREAIRQNHTSHNVSVNAIPEQIEGILTTNPQQFAFYSPFNDTLENLTSIQQTVKYDLRNRASTSIEGVISSFKKLKTFMETEYSQQLRPNYGVNSWIMGNEFYKACLKWHLSLDMSPEDVHQKGLDEVERIYKEMKKIMNKLKFSGTVKQFFDSLKNDSRFYGKSKQEILDMFENIVHHRIEPKLAQLFKDLPNLPVKIEEMPNDGPGGMYSPGLADGSRPGIFYLNLFRPQQMLTVDFVALSLHETNPGHHLQISYAQTAADIPKYRSDVMYAETSRVPFSFPEYTAYVEGWALYAESLGEEMKIYQNDYEIMGRYGSEIFRACRLVVDTGLHHYNWTRDRAIEYMLNYTTFSKGDIEIEIDRYITWPGQACAYKIGELKIRDLRNKAETELGDRFNIKEFHTVVLKQGSVSLAMLETFVNKWIEDVKKSPVDPTENSCVNGVARFRDFNMLIISLCLIIISFLPEF